MRFKEFPQTAEQASNPAGIKGRRRPGRNDQVSPHLIPLLRDPAAVDILALPLCEAEAPLLDDPLALARGIVFGLALSVPLWAIIAGAIWVVLR